MRHWTLRAWCEKRDAYRNFCFDHMRDIVLLTEHYSAHPQRNLEHYLTQIVGIEDEQKSA